MGTPEAAVPSLKVLHEGHDIALVITQPDRPKGRSGRPTPPPVKKTATELGLRVAQPPSRHDLEDVVDGIGDFDLGVVVAYGQILSASVLRAPEFGYINVHFSLLPRWRGAAPVARALMAGDPMSGVTIIRLDEGLDTGPVLTAQAVDISEGTSAGALTDTLASLGARLLGTVLTPYLAGDLEPIPQTEEGATYAAKIDKADRPISPAEDIDTVLGKIRGLSPRPGATLDIDGSTTKVLAASRSEATPPQGTWEIIDGVPVIGLADGGIELTSIQPPGKTPQDGRSWANGRHESAGTLT